MGANVKTSEAQDGDLILLAPAANQVGRMARAGASWTLGMTLARQLLSIGTTAILARYLLPEDYGIIGMVGTFTALLYSLSSMGLTMATVQRRKLTMAQVHNLFWINAGTGILIWLVCIAAAPLIAGFYGLPELTPVAIALGASFAINGFGAQPSALLQRRMLFRQLTLIEIGTQASTAVLAIALAVSGWGYWALVTRSIAASIIGLVLAFAVSKYRPGSPRRNVGTRDLVSFGGFLALSGLVTYLATNTDNILVGRVWGPEELGYYTRAYFLMTLPGLLFTNSIARVMLPALSALAGDTDAMARAYRKALRAMVFAGLPTSIGLAATAPEAVRLIYGPAWSPVVPIYAWLSIATAIQVIGGTTYWLYTASGRSRLQFTINLLSTMCLIIMLLIATVVSDSTVGIAMTYVLWNVLFVFPRAYYAHRVSRMSLATTLAGVRGIVVVTACMGLLVVAAGWSVSALWDNWLLVLSIKVIVGIVAYGVMSVLWLRPLPIPLPGPIGQRLDRIGFGSPK